MALVAIIISPNPTLGYIYYDYYYCYYDSLLSYVTALYYVMRVAKPIKRATKVVVLTSNWHHACSSRLRRLRGGELRCLYLMIVSSISMNCFSLLFVGVDTMSL